MHRTVNPGPQGIRGTGKGQAKRHEAVGESAPLGTVGGSRRGRSRGRRGAGGIGDPRRPGGAAAAVAHAGAAARRAGPEDVGAPADRDGRGNGVARAARAATNTVTHVALPAGAPAPSLPSAPLTPQQAAHQVLARIGPTTAVSVDSNVTVAGEAAYQ